MVLVWQRLGFLALIIPLTVMTLCGMVGARLSAGGLEAVDAGRKIGLAVGIFLAAAIVGVLGLWMNRRTRTVVADPVTGAQVTVKESGGHNMFWIPMQYWAIAWVLFGLVFLFLK